MGISTSPKAAGARRANINVTPLVDVVLVMLIVFLVSAPLLLRHHEVEVPPKDGAGTPATPIAVTVHGDGSVTIDGGGGGARTVPLVELAAAAYPIVGPAPDRLVVLDVDDALPFDVAVQTIDTLRGVGAGQVVLARRAVAELP